MSGGGIIIQRAKVLLVAATDSCFFDSLPQHCKDKVNAIDGKPELSRDLTDVMTLLGILQVAVHC